MPKLESLMRVQVCGGCNNFKISHLIIKPVCAFMEKMVVVVFRRWCKELVVQNELIVSQRSLKRHHDRHCSFCMSLLVKRLTWLPFVLGSLCVCWKTTVFIVATVTVKFETCFKAHRRNFCRTVESVRFVKMVGVNECPNVYGEILCKMCGDFMQPSNCCFMKKDYREPKSYFQLFRLGDASPGTCSLGKSLQSTVAAS